MIRTIRRDRRLTAISAMVAALSALIAFVIVAQPAQAAVSRAFTIRHQDRQHGDIVLRGNSLVTCNTAVANCTQAINRTATGNNLNNNAYTMQFIDTDADGSTRSSSTADVSLPAGGSVLWAGLYWSAYTASGGGTTRTASPAGTAKNRLLFKAPGDTAYRTITASNVDDGTSVGTPYVSFADVTGIVTAAGAGTYTGADIYAALGADSYAAWSLVAMVKDPAQPMRQLTVFDGFGTVQNAPASDQDIQIPLSGFETPPSGQVDVKLGTVAFEGDAGSTGDALKVIPPASSGMATTTLTDAQNPPDNYFNSTISDSGNAVTARNPNQNTFGFDADVFSSSLLLGNSATSATLDLNTGGETYFPAVATFVANIYAPDLGVVQSGSTNDVDGDNRTGPGDRIDYTVTVTNNGPLNSAGTVLTSPIPAGTSYLPGSLRIAGSTRTDAADSDPAEVSGGNLVFRLGTGAGGSGGTGGTLTPGASVTYTYSVLLTGPFASAGDSVSETSAAAYASPGGTTFNSASNTFTTAISQARSDLEVTHTVDPEVVQENGSRTVTYTIVVTNNGPDRESAPVLSEALPSGFTVTSTSGTCTGTTTLTCALAALDSGDSATVTVTGDLDPGATGTVTATASASGDGIDPDPSNDSAPADVDVNQEPAAANDPASLPGTTLSADIDALANDTDPDGNTPLELDSAGPASHGDVTIVGGQVRYTLTDYHFTGTDTFPYTVCDSAGGCSTAQITVNVAAHQVADLAVTHTAAPVVVQRNGVRTVTWTAVVTNNGPDAEASPALTEVLPTGATAISSSGGTCVTANTTLSCTLPALASGDTATLTFTATLPGTAPDPSTATATVTGSELDPDDTNDEAGADVGVNTEPVATPDNARLSKAVTSVALNVLANDTDADGDALTLSAVTAPAHGTATITNGKIVYAVTDKGFAGNDTFTYTVCDGRGGCDTTTVTVAVSSHDNAPVAASDSAKTPTGTKVSIPVLANDTDPDGDRLVLGRIVTAPSHGTAVINGTKIVYTPDDGWIGPDKLSYEVCDASGLCDKAVVSITVTSLPPVANTDSGNVRPGGSVVVDPVTNDTDPDGGTLGDVTIVQQPKYGTAYVDSDGKIHYQAPSSGVPGGKVTIRYQTCNPSGACAQSTIVLAVKGTPVTGTSGSGDPLAFTGANVSRLLGLALLLMLLGLAFIGLSRRSARPALAWRSYGTTTRYSPRPPRWR